MVQKQHFQPLASIVTGNELRLSHANFIGEVVRGSFRFSFLKRLNDWSQIAYRIRYREYEKKTSVKLGYLATLNEDVTVKMTVGFTLKQD